MQIYRQYFINIALVKFSYQLQHFCPLSSVLRKNSHCFSTFYLLDKVVEMTILLVENVFLFLRRNSIYLVITPWSERAHVQDRNKCWIYCISCKLQGTNVQNIVITLKPTTGYIHCVNTGVIIWYYLYAV